MSEVNYFDVLDDKAIDGLFKIMAKSSNNQKKASAYYDLLKNYGFRKLSDIKKVTTNGLGTNQYVLTHPAHKKVVYKFALDSFGLEDNYYDDLRQNEIKRHSVVYQKHYTDMVAVHKMYTPIETFDEIRPFLKSILKELDKLSREYILVDLSPKYNYRNYGIDPDTKDWVFIDCSDIFLKDYHGIDIEMECERLRPGKTQTDPKVCGGELVYNDYYHTLECVKCGYESNPLMLKPKLKEVSKVKNSSFSLGMSHELVLKMNSAIEGMRANNRKGSSVTLTVSERKEPEPVKESVSEAVIELKKKNKPKFTLEEVCDGNCGCTDKCENCSDDDDEIITPTLDNDEESDDDDDEESSYDDDSDDEYVEEDTDEEEQAREALQVEVTRNDDGSEEQSPTYPISAYSYSTKLREVIRNKDYASFIPVGKKLFTVPYSISGTEKTQPITEFIDVTILLKDDEQISFEVEEMILAIEEDETEYMFNVTGSIVEFDTKNESDVYLIPQKITSLDYLYNYDLDVFKSRLGGIISDEHISTDDGEVTIDYPDFREMSYDDFIDSDISFMFKKYGTKSTRMFEVLIKDALYLRLA